MKLKHLIDHKATVPVLAAVAGVVNGGVIGYILGKLDGDVFIVPSEWDDGEVATEPGMDVPLPFEEYHLPETISFERPTPTKVVLTEEQAEAIKLEDMIRANPNSEIIRDGLMKVLGQATMSQDDEGNATAEIELNDDGVEVAERLETEHDRAMAILKQSVFDNPWPEWNWDAERAQRGERDPYVITQDEYAGEEAGFRQSSMTFYAGDDVLTDEDDAPVSNYQDLVGSPLKFGYGSRNSDVVFIRNPRLEMDYEVVRSYDSYAHAVLGIDAEDALEEEIIHSRYPVRGFRDE